MLSKIISDVDAFVWGPVMLVLLVGTGILLTIRCNFLTWRNLPWAIIKTLSKESRTKNRGEGDVSPFSALTTALAATIGTGNIVGVATAMVSGGAGALVWMWISACFGLSSKFSECMLAIKYREVNEKGEMSGGPMYTMKKALKNKKLGAVLGWLFALFAVIASFGIGNMTQGNSIATSVHATFGVSVTMVGVVITVLALLIIIGGIKTISKVSSVVVPVMAIFYVVAGIIVILGNIHNLPAGISMIFKMAFSFNAVGGGLCGAITAAMMNAMRYGVARGLFSNEAGMGSTPHAHAIADVENPEDQGEVAMIGVFIDTFVVLTMTALVILSSGVLEEMMSTGVKGTPVAQAAFRTGLKGFGPAFVAICLLFFAFSTIVGWYFFARQNVQYLFGKKAVVPFSLIVVVFVFLGSLLKVDLVWNLSDLFNGLMVIPNLMALIVLAGTVAKAAKGEKVEF